MTKLARGETYEQFQAEQLEMIRVCRNLIKAIRKHPTSELSRQVIRTEQQIIKNTYADLISTRRENRGHNEQQLLEK